MARKRIGLSVRPEYHEKLVQLSKYQNTTITGIVGELLDECETAVDSILKAYAEIEKGVDKNKVINNLLADGFDNLSDNLRKYK